MSAFLGVEIRGARELEKKLETARLGLVTSTVRGVARATVETRNALFLAMSASKVPDNFFGFRSPAGPVLAARTGDTRRSLSPGRVWRAGSEIFGVVGHSAPHVLALETGATVRPTSSTFLRIPLAAALTGAGQDRNVGRSIRGVPGFFVYPSRRMRESGRAKTRNLFIARSVNGRLVLWYLLKTEVKLPEKKLFETTRERMRPRFVAILGADVSRVVAAAN